MGWEWREGVEGSHRLVCGVRGEVKTERPRGRGMVWVGRRCAWADVGGCALLLETWGGWWMCVRRGVCAHMLEGGGASGGAGEMAP